MATPFSFLPAPIAIVFIDISRCDYSEKVSEHDIYSKLKNAVCPVCGKAGEFRPHDKYFKHCGEDLILIRRVRCICRKTHAVIPSFSLPGWSISVEDAEKYLLLRKKGETRAKAGAIFPVGSDAIRRGRRLEKRFHEVVSEGKALFPHPEMDHLFGICWLSAFAGSTPGSIYAANIRCQKNLFGALFFSRTDRIIFSSNRSGTRVSHNVVFDGDITCGLDSS